MNVPGSGRAATLHVTILFILVTTSVAIQPAPDLPGPYCGARAPKFQCCEGRSDSCSVAIVGTLCYCDKFCKNTTNDDCCPDYDVVCENKPLELKGKQPAVSCYFDEQVYEAGQHFKHNCNNCSCTETGEVCCDQSLCVTDANLLRRLRSMEPILRWYPANQTQFWGRKYLETLAAIARTKRPRESNDMVRARKHAEYLAKLKSSSKGVPEFFDAREKWPNLISPIADQNWCNTAWAHSTVSTATDRLRIQSNVPNIQLSVEEMIDCSRSRQKGCRESGQMERAWNFLRKRGLHSTHHYHRECFNTTRKDRRYKSGPLYLTVGEANIRREIYESGPVQATMRVYRDFFSYGSGIYSASDDSERAGFLAVKIIGWGEERGVKYWIAANSWGTGWGERGYFRIKRGTNECGIEEYVFAAWGTPVRFPDGREDITSVHTMKTIAGSPGRRRLN